MYRSTSEFWGRHVKFPVFRGSRYSEVRFTVFVLQCVNPGVWDRNLHPGIGGFPVLRRQVFGGYTVPPLIHVVQ